jgi:fumarate hydratase subunit beta
MTEVHALDCTLGLSPDAVTGLRAGDAVVLTGVFWSFRDATAARLVGDLQAARPMPVDLRHQVLYAVGPSPAKPGHVVGSAGPTTTARMARFLPTLLAAGVQAVLGKGELHGADAEVFVRHQAVYLAAVGGLGALLARRITRATVEAYPELGPEALFRLEVAAFPAVVIIDTQGRNFHEIARARWRRSPTSPPDSR